MNFRFDRINQSEIIYAPQYLSNQGILETVDMDEEFHPSSYLYFDSIEFKEIFDFINHLKEKLLSKHKLDPNASILYKDSEVGDNILFKTICGVLEIRIPPRTAPLDITRKYVILTSRVNNKIITLNQPVTEIDQIILEASLIL